MLGKIEFFDSSDKYEDRIFNISKGLKPYLENVLSRNDIRYMFRGPEKIIVPLSGTQFHKMVIRAKCEKLNDEEHLSEEETYFVPKIESEYLLTKLGYNFFREYPSNK